MGIIYIIELGFIYSISFLFVFFWDEYKGFFYYPRSMMSSDFDCNYWCNVNLFIAKVMLFDCDGS